MSLLPPNPTIPTRRLAQGLRRLFAVSFVLATIAAASVWADSVPPTDASTLSSAVAFLTHEKSAAEQYAVILATVGKDDAARYVRGIQLYADAKAEFDALVAELRFDLVSGSNLATSPKVSDAMQRAAEKRVAFTSFVSDQIVAKQPGTKPGLPDVIEVVPNLVKAITDSGIAIWKAYHDAGKERRDAILSELDQLRWRSFEEVVKT